MREFKLKISLVSSSRSTFKVKALNQLYVGTYLFGGKWRAARYRNYSLRKEGIQISFISEPSFEISVRGEGRSHRCVGAPAWPGSCFARGALKTDGQVIVIGRKAPGGNREVIVRGTFCVSQGFSRSEEPLTFMGGRGCQVDPVASPRGEASGTTSPPPNLRSDTP